MLKRLLIHPLTKGLDIDSPKTTELRRRIIREKAFLRLLYIEWYDRLAAALPRRPGPVLELGSGGGFLEEILPEVITSEVFACAGVKSVVDARSLPFENESLRGIVMVDVFHHIPDVGAFLGEATRCLRPGGVVAMIEPWSSPWSRLVYNRLHHEPFEPAVRNWTLPELGPLSGANGALPWIVFNRDKEAFERLFPFLRLELLELDYPFSYLASGGVSLRPLSPGGSYKYFRKIEKYLPQRLCAMFALIVIKKYRDSRNN
jgi:SAM-dependent methyltransferase